MTNRPAAAARGVLRFDRHEIGWRRDGAADARTCVLLAHGAGAPSASPFMEAVAGGLAAGGVGVLRFDFPYMHRRVAAGRRAGAPDPAAVLLASFRTVMESVRSAPKPPAAIVLGGKSMGGRMATQLAASDPALPVAGLVLFGYPLHPPGNPAKRRDGHLPSVQRPMLVIQGSRDTFGTPDELHPVFDALVPAATIHVVDGGDHSFKVARAGAAGQAAIDDGVRNAAVEWMLAVMARADARG